LSLDPKLLVLVIRKVFANSKVVKDRGYLQFDKRKGWHDSAWEYRIAFRVPDPKCPMFHALVATIYIWADIMDESSQWGFRESTKKSLGINMVSQKLEITKYFDGREPA
jgi:hypothetical protein